MNELAGANVPQASSAALASCLRSTKGPKVLRGRTNALPKPSRIRRRFCQRGLEGTVRRKAPDREYERKLDGGKEAELIRLACSQAPDGRSAWSLRLLADEMVALGIVDTLSHETVRRTLKKTD